MGAGKGGRRPGGGILSGEAIAKTQVGVCVISRVRVWCLLARRVEGAFSRSPVLPHSRQARQVRTGAC